ncbi:hypothetical protein D3C71_1560830 [compost metagenome]
MSCLMQQGSALRPVPAPIRMHNAIKLPDGVKREFADCSVFQLVADAKRLLRPRLEMGRDGDTIQFRIDIPKRRATFAKGRPTSIRQADQFELMIE